MIARLWDLLALIGLACVVSTPLVLAMFALAGRREEDDEPEPPLCEPQRHGTITFGGITCEVTDWKINPPADPVRELAARAKGGDE